MKHSTRPIALVATLLFLLLSMPSLRAQNAIASSANSIVQSTTDMASTAVTTGIVSDSAQVMIENRARTLGNRITATGTRYFAVTDSDLHGKTPDQVLQRLSPPPITAGSPVKDVQVVVELNHPLTLYASNNQSADIGTVVLLNGANVKDISVESSIYTSGVTVLPK